MAETLFVTSTELADLTGRKLKSHQADWLRTNGIPFVLSATGHPRVARIALLARMGAPVSGQGEDTTARRKPNFEALRQGRNAA